LDWVQQIREAPIPAIPIFDEEMSSVEKRARELVGKVRCPRKFEPVHPLFNVLLLLYQRPSHGNAIPLGQNSR
jgi:hypothetical protein